MPGDAIGIQSIFSGRAYLFLFLWIMLPCTFHPALRIGRAKIPQLQQPSEDERAPLTKVEGEEAGDAEENG